MSQEIIELARRGVDAFNRRDVDAMLALTDPNVEYYSRIAELEGGEPYRGHDGVRHWFDILMEIAPDYNSEIEEIRAIGDTTLARVVQRGLVGEGEVPMEQTYWFLSGWQDGKNIWTRVCLSEAEALEAAGLRE